MADEVKKETFVSSATIYSGAAVHGHPPGTALELHPDVAADLRKAGLEQKPEEQKPAEKPQSKASAKGE